MASSHLSPHLSGAGQNQWFLVVDIDLAADGLVGSGAVNQVAGTGETPNVWRRASIEQPTFQDTSTGANHLQWLVNTRRIKELSRVHPLFIGIEYLIFIYLYVKMYISVWI